MAQAGLPVQWARRQGLMAAGTGLSPNERSSSRVGGFVSSLGKDWHRRRSARCSKREASRFTIKTGSYLQRRPRGTIPCSTGSLRDVTTVRDRSGSRPLRNIPLTSDESPQQRDFGQIYLSVIQKSARRIPAAGAGDPHVTDRDKSAHPGMCGRIWTCSSSKSAARSATSSRCRFSKPFASFASDGHQNSHLGSRDADPYLGARAS